MMKKRRGRVPLARSQVIDKSAPLNDDESVRAEVAILRRLRHASIVGLVEVRACSLSLSLSLSRG